MAPPPEPMASTRSVGTLIGWWLITVVVARTGSPSTIEPGEERGAADVGGDDVAVAELAAQRDAIRRRRR